jgi:hypothetical protein
MTYDNNQYVVGSVLSIGITPATASADSAVLVGLNLLMLASVITCGILIHKRLKKGIK